MGVWGPQSFANDMAADWLHDLEEEGWPLVLRTLRAGAEPRPPFDLDQVCLTVAAGEVVAILAGASGTGADGAPLALSPARTPTPQAGALDAALPQAAEILRGVWAALAAREAEAGPGFGPWRANIDGLAARLEAAAAKA